MIPIGFTLQPDEEFLGLLDGVIRAVDYWEVAPETTWHEDERGRLGPNGFWRRFAALADEVGRPFVAHGVGLSMGTASARDAPRRRRWLARVAEDHRRFRFRWYTEHLGATAPDGQALALPLPLPMTGEVARVVRRHLAAMRRVVPEVGLENPVFYFALGEPLDEPAFIGRALEGGGALLLDLHNLHTAAMNFGFDEEAYLARLDLARVIEIHVSGGSWSDGAWLPSGRSMRLDGHDGAIPEAVWRLLERVAPRCPGLRGVTLERMEGTVRNEEEVRRLRHEIARLRRVLG